MTSEAQRLNRYLAACGLGSRRGVEVLVAEGRVAIDGVIADSPGQRVEEGSVVTLDGAPVAPDAHAYVLLNKPKDVVTTVRDTHGRRTVIELVGADRRLFPVGRLDAETTGLLLLTNDGELAARLMHPRHGVEKTYEATVRGAVTVATAQRLASGIELDGKRTAPAQGARHACDRPAERRRDHPPRGPQAPGAADVRGGRPSRDLAAPLGLRAGCGSGRSKAGASRPLLPAEVELLRSAAANG